MRQPEMTTHTMGFDTRTNLRFMIEMIVGVAILLLVTFAAHHVPLRPGTVMYTIVQLLPVPAVWLLPFAMLRHYWRLDELQQLKLLQSISLTAGNQIGVAWSLPALSKAFGWPASNEGCWDVSYSVLFVVV